MSHFSTASLLAAGALGLALRAPQSSPADVFPSDVLQRYVLAVMDSYPVDGTHRYWWPRGADAPKGWVGNSKDLVYGSEVLYRGDPKRRGYCCGLTFEVFFEAWRAACVAHGRKFAIGGLDRKGVHALRRAWFGSSIGDSCMRDALVERGLGYEIEDRADARPGDFVQLWRTNGSGHSVVFLRWIWGLRTSSDSSPDSPAVARPRIVGIEYWSTQKSTRGIGVRREYFIDPGDPRGARVPNGPRKEPASERRVCPESTYIVRAGRAPKAR